MTRRQGKTAPTDRPNLELVTTIAVGYGLTALLYRKAVPPPRPEPIEPWSQPEMEPW